jgi:hypothetical protein
MNNYDDILDKFKDGTAVERLNLYLHHRNLRVEFNQIEDEENSLLKREISDSPYLVIKPSRENEQRSFLVRMKCWLLSVLS